MNKATRTPSTVKTKTSRSTSQWAHIIADYHASDLTQRAFCELRKVPYGTFVKQLMDSRKEPLIPKITKKVKSSPLFVEVETSTGVSDVKANRTEWDVELAFANGMILRLKQSQG